MTWPDVAPPPAEPTAPRRRLPPGSCDTHLHVFAPPDRHPLDPRRGYTPHVCTLDDYRRVMDRLGIDRAVLVQPSVYGTDNGALLDALRSGDGVLRGVVVPDPAIGDAALRDMHALGVRGLRLNLVNPAVLSVDDAVALCRRVAPMGWHLQLQVALGTQAGEAMPDLLRRTELPVVVDHMGRAADEAALEPLLEAMATGRVWVKLSAPYRNTATPTPHADLLPRIAALRGARADRLLWGTDWPHTELQGTTPQAGDLADLLEDWLPDEALRQAVLVGNPARLYGY